MEIRDAMDVKVTNRTVSNITIYNNEGEILMTIDNLNDCSIRELVQQYEFEKTCLRCSQNSSSCITCIHNPDAELEDNFVDKGYVSTCKYGFDDCICDPAYSESKGREGGDCDGCIDGSWYDDEDK